MRIWGLTAQRGWARLILGRFRDLVLSPGDPTAATREPDSVLHEHHTVFFPDTGRGTATRVASRSTIRFFAVGRSLTL